MGVINVPFAIPNVRIENPEATAHTRIGWFRSVSNIPHAFAVQSFVAELAAAAGRDPKDYLLELIGPAAQIESAQMLERHLEPRRIARALSGRHRPAAPRHREWPRRRRAGAGSCRQGPAGSGIAAHYSFVSYVAAVVRGRRRRKGELTIPRVDIAVDCGATVNPDRVRSQMEGACVMGVGVATLRRDQLQGGRVGAGQLPRLRGRRA